MNIYLFNIVSSLHAPRSAAEADKNLTEIGRPPERFKSDYRSSRVKARLGESEGFS